MPAALTFFKNEKVIQVDDPQTALTIQDVHDQIRNYEAELINLDLATIANAYGKQPLGGGAYVGITLELINDWRIAFEARPGPDTILCMISGGNLVAINQYNNNPIKPTAYTQVVIAQATSPSIITPPSDYGLLYLVESLRGRHASIGDIWYWNPTSGSDGNDGTTPQTAVATFSKAQTLATAGKHDVIFALATATGGITTVTEKITISKANLKVRGPGFNFQFIPTSAGTPTVQITADNVEFSGFYVETAAGGTDNGITVTGDNALIKDVWVKEATGNGIDVSSTARTTIDTCAIEDCTGVGISVGTPACNLMIRQCIISGNTGDGAELTGGATVLDNIFENNLIYHNTGYGIHIGSAVLRTGVRLHHTFSGNATGNQGQIQDDGSGTFIETPAGGESASTIADAVWNELISEHTGVGSTGKTLRDAKVKATLASLK